MVLVNRASDASWTQEGVYVFFAADLARPETFTPPRKLHDGGEWYCQVIGDAGMRGTDSLAGQSARFFMKGKSNHRVVFERPAAANAAAIPGPSPVGPVAADILVADFEGDVIFLHEVTEGAADRSYGIQVAKLAGLPKSAVERARAVLARRPRGVVVRSIGPKPSCW
mgnify:CR=1 FL=1